MKKSILLIIILCFFALLAYNKTKIWAKDVSETGMRTIICEQGEIKNPQCRAGPPAPLPVDKICSYLKKMPCDGCGGCPATQACCCDAGENILEIPIGRAVDQAEYLANEIANEIGILIQNANQLNEKVTGMPGLVNQCNVSRCQPKCEKKIRTIAQWCDLYCDEMGPGWYETPCAGCVPACSARFICCCTKEEYYESSPCQGNACPPEIAAAQNEINSLSQTTLESQQKIADLVKQMEQVFEKLQESRNKLADCVIRPVEAEALERGESMGKFLLNCEIILNSGIPIHSYLGKNLDDLQEGCYGNLYCQALDEQSKELPYPPGPCADDYYCCY